MTRVAYFIACLAIGFCSYTACSHDPAAEGPTSSELHNRFRVELPAYVSVSSFDVEASENVGDKVDPMFKSRFKASLKLDVDTFNEVARQDGTIFVAPRYSAGERRDVFGRAVSTLKGGSWQITFQLDNNPIPDMGRPRDFFVGGNTIIKGSPEETAFIEEQRRKRDRMATDGLLLHLDAGTGVMKDAANRVTAWHSQTSELSATAAVGSQPVWIGDALHGLPVVRFDGGREVMRLSAAVGVLPGTVFFVYRSFGTEVGGSILGDSRGNIVQKGGMPNPYQVGNLYSGNFLFETGPSFRLMEHDNATSPGGTAIYSSGALVLSGDVGWREPPTVSIIGERSDGMQFVGDVAEILVYNRVLAIAERIGTGRYLSRKYGLSSSYLNEE